MGTLTNQLARDCQQKGMMIACLFIKGTTGRLYGLQGTSSVVCSLENITYCAPFNQCQTSLPNCPELTLPHSRVMGILCVWALSGSPWVSVRLHLVMTLHFLDIFVFGFFHCFIMCLKTNPKVINTMIIPIMHSK